MCSICLSLKRRVLSHLCVCKTFAVSVCHDETNSTKVLSARQMLRANNFMSNCVILFRKKYIVAFRPLFFQKLQIFDVFLCFNADLPTV